jgi:hypothetical protein
MKSTSFVMLSSQDVKLSSYRGARSLLNSDEIDFLAPPELY